MPTDDGGSHMIVVKAGLNLMLSTRPTPVLRMLRYPLVSIIYKIMCTHCSHWLQFVLANACRQMFIDDFIEMHNYFEISLNLFDILLACGTNQIIVLVYR